jgi:two-component system response regulator FlrC
VPDPAAETQVTPLEMVEKEHILRAIEICEGNRTQAAKQLGISIRTLRNKLNEYGMNARDDGSADS